MKKLFMLSLAALVFVPAVYAQQPAQTSELAKFAPPMIPFSSAIFMVSFEGIPMTQAPLARTASFPLLIISSVKKGLAPSCINT